MRGTLVETLIGALVLVVAGWFLYFAFTSTDMSRSGGYEISAQFERIDGLGVGADVRVSVFIVRRAVCRPARVPEPGLAAAALG